MQKVYQVFSQSRQLQARHLVVYLYLFMFRHLLSYISGQRTQGTINLLIDSSDDTLITFSGYDPAVKFLAESTMDVQRVPSLAARSLPRAIFSIQPRTYPEWSWDASGRNVVRSAPFLVTDEKRSRSQLLTGKVRAIARIYRHIMIERSRIDTGLLFQQEIYGRKREEAEMLKGAGFDELLRPKTPFISDYAEDNNISLRQAAEEVLLQVRLDEDLLRKTERARQQLLERIRSARTVEEIAGLLRPFEVIGTV